MDKDNITDYIHDNKVRLDLKNNETEYMDINEFSRWCALMSGIDLILSKAECLGRSANDNSWIKPIYIEKYINEKSQEYIDELEHIIKVNEQKI